MDVTNTLQRVLDSTYRIAALQTQETDRLVALFKRYTLTTGQAVYSWTPQGGLYRLGVEPIFIPRTRTPTDVLAYIAASRHYGIYLLRDFESALAKSSIQNTLCSLSDIDDGVRRLVLLMGAYPHLPPLLQGRVATIRHNVRERAAASPASAGVSVSTPTAEARRTPVALAQHPYLVSTAEKYPRT